MLRIVAVIGLSYNCFEEITPDALKRDTCRLEIRKYFEPAEDQSSAAASQ